MRAVFFCAASAALLAGMDAHASDLDNFKAQYEFVPVEVYLERLTPNLMECYDYDPETNTCDGIGNTVLINGEIKTIATFILSEEPDVSVVLSESAWIVDGLACSDGRDLKVEFETEEFLGSDFLLPFVAKGMHELFEWYVAEYGEICDAYFKTDKGYEIFSFDSSGNTIPDIFESSGDEAEYWESSIITHFETPPPLRVGIDEEDL